MKRFSTVIFDVDGTLIDSNGAHAAAWHQALHERGHRLDIDRVRSLIGMGSDKFLPATAGVPADSAEGKALSARKKALFGARLATLQPTHGSRALEHLRDAGVEVAVATSVGEVEMQALLRQAGVEDLIPLRTSKDDAGRSKPDPDIVLAALAATEHPRHQTVMVGDTPYDVEAARRAGIDAIALRCGGYWSDRALAGAMAVADDPAALLTLWGRDCGDEVRGR